MQPALRGHSFLEAPRELDSHTPLQLVLLGPVLVNILLFHLLMMPATILPGIVFTLLWLIVFFAHRSAFAGIFTAKA